jgi:hypothetical protein
VAALRRALRHHAGSRRKEVHDAARAVA